jgi:hypothetical protein
MMFLLSLGAVALFAQAPPVQPKPETKSIADKTKFKLYQIEIDDAIKTQQLIQTNWQQQLDKAMAQPQKDLQDALLDAMKACGIPEAEKDEWQYDPSTFTFTKKQAPMPPPTPVVAKPAAPKPTTAPVTPPAKPVDKK